MRIGYLFATMVGIALLGCGSNKAGGGSSGGSAGVSGYEGGAAGGSSGSGGSAGYGGSAATGGTGGSAAAGGAGGTGAAAGTGGGGTAGTDGGAGTSGGGAGGTDGGAGTDGGGTAGAGGTAGGGGGGTGGDSGSCTDKCTAGVAQCFGNQLQTCGVQGTGCTDWNAPQDCPTGQSCSAGQCVTQCTNNCTAGNSQCVGAQIQSCSVQSNGCTDWNTAQDCPTGQTCSGGQCATQCTNNCTAGNSQCVGAQIQTCSQQSNGCTDWDPAQDCPTGQTCQAGACVSSCTDQCTVGATQCSGGQIQTCSVQGTGCTDWDAAVDCPSGQTCSAGQCVLACTDKCTAGATQCSGSQVQTCAMQASGCTDWGAAQDCAAGKTCQGTACACYEAGGPPCTPGATRCQGNDVQVCNDAGTAWLYSSTCSSTCCGGFCDPPCTPGATRCNGDTVEQCNSTGNGWTATQSCSTSCYAPTGQCEGTDITVDVPQNLDGNVALTGCLTVKSGATLTVPSGVLTVHAQCIVVEAGASIVVTPTGTTPDGKGKDGSVRNCCGCEISGGGGGGYGLASTSSPGCNVSIAGPAFGSSTDSLISAGSPGGTGASQPVYSYGGAGGKGGGVVRLYANSITIAGSIIVNGEDGYPAVCPYGASTGAGGGGSGGGVLLAADSVAVSGSISTAGGAPGNCPCLNTQAATAGARGRIKIFWGSSHSVTGTLTGTVTESVMPPLTVTSTTHPDPSLVYNDGAPSLDVSWSRPFATRLGYYYVLDANASHVPAGTDTFTSNESATFPATALVPGANYFHIITVDGASNLGTAETSLKIQINSQPPTISSSSHPEGVWTANNNVLFSWTFPQPDASLQGAYYVMDHWADTMPTAADTFVPVSQKQLLMPGVADGIWVLHMLSVDTRGYLTKAADSYQVWVGADPGSGGMVGLVTDQNGQPVQGAAIVINRGLFSQTTNSTGNYTFTLGSLPAGTWEARAEKAGYQDDVKNVVITAGQYINTPFTLSP